MMDELTVDELRVAERLGLTAEQYAKGKVPKPSAEMVAIDRLRILGGLTFSQVTEAERKALMRLIASEVHKK